MKVAKHCAKKKTLACLHPFFGDLIQMMGKSEPCPTESSTKGGKAIVNELAVLQHLGQKERNTSNRDQLGKPIR